MSTAVVTPGRENDRISGQTVRNRLADYSISATRPYHRSRLTPPHRRYRAHWPCQHLRWTSNQWNTALFSDELCFCLDHPNGCMRCYCRCDECYNDAYVFERDHFGGPSVTVWGAISFHRHSELICILRFWHLL